MTRPEVVAAVAEALDLGFECCILHDDISQKPQHVAASAIAHLPAPFAIVDMDALVERVARLIDDHGWDYGDDEERESLRVKARAAIEGGRT